MFSPGYSDDIRVSQGAASDGTYAYFVVRHVDDKGAVVYKHHLDTGELVAHSEVLQLGHGNDATFDTKNNRLVVAHALSQDKILTLLDPDTLSVIEDINIPVGSDSITYSEKKDRYAIGQGGSGIHLLDANFKRIISFSRQQPSSYIVQGMGSDEDYLYFPMSGNKDNILDVYNWNGNYVSTIHVRSNYESESMFWVNDTHYISYFTDSQSMCTALHRLEFRALYVN